MSDDTPFVIPELFDGEKWTVDTAKNLGGTTNFQAHHMYAPIPNDWLPAAVALHEMAHAKWTPRSNINDEAYASGQPKDAAMNLLVQGCEDRRIHHLLSETVSDWPQYGGAMVRYANGIPCPSKLSDQVVLEMASRQEFGKPVCEISDKAREIAYFAEAMILYNPNDPAVTWEAARYIRDATMEDGGEEEGESDDSDAPDDGGCDDRWCDCHDSDYPEEYHCDDDDDYDEEDDDPRPATWLPDKTWKSDTPLPKVESPSLARRIRGDVSEYGEGWCDMDIAYYPYTRSIPRHRVIGRGKKSATEGTVPRHIHRLPVGGKIFRQKHKGRKIGGTVLVDTSGSMSIDSEDIENLLKEVHHGTVAIYASDSNRLGSLAVIARHYRAVRDIPSLGGGNGVDGPALGWLATQPEPRAWICDGWTTGIHDNGYGRDECEELERKHRIIRYSSIDSYVGDIPAVGLRS